MRLSNGVRCLATVVRVGFRLVSAILSPYLLKFLSAIEWRSRPCGDSASGTVTVYISNPEAV